MQCLHCVQGSLELSDDSDTSPSFRTHTESEVDMSDATYEASSSGGRLRKASGPLIQRAAKVRKTGSVRGTGGTSGKRRPNRHGPNRQGSSESGMRLPNNPW